MPTLPTLSKRSQAALDAKLRQYELRIAKLHREALVTIRSDMALIYDKYADQGMLTRAEMTRYNRLASLEKRLVADMAPAVRGSVNTIRKLTPDMYQEAFFRYGWAIDNAAAVRLNWGNVNLAAVVEELDNPLRQAALRGYRQDVALRMVRAVNKDLVLGKSYPAMMQDIKAVVDLKNYQALRIARTEGHTAMSAGTDAAYNRAIEKGVKMSVRWLSTIDDRVRDTHAAVDGQIRDDEGFFTVGGVKTPYPGWEGMRAEERINCRCTTIAEVEGYEFDFPPGGEYQTYEEWLRG